MKKVGKLVAGALILGAVGMRAVSQYKLLKTAIEEEDAKKEQETDETETEKEQETDDSVKTPDPDMEIKFEIKNS